MQDIQFQDEHFINKTDKQTFNGRTKFDQQSTNDCWQTNLSANTITTYNTLDWQTLFIWLWMRLSLTLFSNTHLPTTIFFTLYEQPILLVQTICM